jgi:transposase
MSPPHTPPPSSRRVEADTIKRTRFFQAIDHREKKSIPTICREENVSLGTGKKWLRQRKELGTPTASRRIDKMRTGPAASY